MKSSWVANVWLLALALAVALPSRGEEVQEVAEGTRALYRGEYEQARTLASKYLEAHPEASPARILLARAEIAQGQYEPAYQDLRKALDLDPANIDALYYLERLCAILAQIEFRRLMETAPNSFRAHQVAAESYLMQTNQGEAEKEYQAALKSNPNSVEILDALGELKRSQFDFEEALEYYARASKLAPRDYTSAYGSGACRLYQQNAQRAIQSFRRALEIDPSSAAAHLALGDALLRANQAAAAVVELKAAIALSPQMRQAYTLLARACQKLGLTREAEQALQKEQELTRKDVKTRETTLDSDDGVSEPQPPQAREPAAPQP
jgi:protein O-GlcNAc transferase